MYAGCFLMYFYNYVISVYHSYMTVPPYLQMQLAVLFVSVER